MSQFIDLSIFRLMHKIIYPGLNVPGASRKSQKLNTHTHTQTPTK